MGKHKEKGSPIDSVVLERHMESLEPSYRERLRSETRAWWAEIDKTRRNEEFNHKRMTAPIEPEFSI